MIPFIIKWETGLVQKPGESVREYWQKAKDSKAGFVNDPDDSGGATVVGVTFATFTMYCIKKKTPGAAIVENLKRLSFEQWEEILHSMYWDRWIADHIENQSIAEILVDWIWASGKWGIVIPQRLLGVTADGIVGNKTLTALNKRIGEDAKGLFDSIYQERLAYIDDIIKKNPKNEKFRKGWVNRINDIKFE